MAMSKFCTLGLAVTLALFGLHAGCAGSITPCTPGSGSCPTGQVCDDSLKRCVPDIQRPPDYGIRDLTAVPESGVCPVAVPDRCGTVCVDLTADRDHCGACDKACGPSAVCVGGSCECDEGWSDCNNDSTDGCECAGDCDGSSCQQAGLCSETSAHSCGDAAHYCSAGACVACPAGKQNCDGTGSCECSAGCAGSSCAAGDPCAGVSCGANEECVSGTCQCEAPAVPCNGACVNLGTTDNCKACGDQCGDHAVCAAAGCKCSADWIDCDGNGSCECSANPAALEQCCDNQCVSLSTADHCINCNACGAHAYCDFPVGCKCTSGWTDCDGNGSCECSTNPAALEKCCDNQCVSLSTYDHCIGCAGCGSHAYCDFPAGCKCSSGWTDCDGNGSCECNTGSGMDKCCSGSCVSLGTDAHCTSCTACTSRQYCDFPAGCKCKSAYTNCSGSCVVLDDDLSNCGACGKVCTCPVGQCCPVCIMGDCGCM